MDRGVSPDLSIGGGLVHQKGSTSGVRIALTTGAKGRGSYDERVKPSAAASTESDSVKAIHFTTIKPPVESVAKPNVLSSEALIKSRTAPIVAIIKATEAVRKSILSAREPIAKRIATIKATIPMTSRPTTVPATVSSIMAINKLATLPGAVIIVAAAPSSALISLGGRRKAQHDQQC